MSKEHVNDGGPAFPKTAGAYVPNEGLAGTEQDGMSLRDYFAGQAMIAVIQRGRELLTDGFINGRGAKYCYEIADEMIKAREANSGRN